MKLIFFPRWPEIGSLCKSVKFVINTLPVASHKTVGHLFKCKRFIEYKTRLKLVHMQMGNIEINGV